MPFKTIIGLDHVVVVVHDLAAAAAAWGALGFTLSPRGMHSPLMGTGNHTIMFGEDYVELLGVLTETALNAPSRAFLTRQGEGIERVAFTTTDAAAGVEELRAHGFAGVGPVAFGRPVQRPDGNTTEAEFRVFLWPETDAPGGMRLFACQHLTRDAVWMPELQRHANTATRIVLVELVAPDPQAEAQHLARLIAGEVRSDADGGLRVPSGGGRADFVFRSREAFARLHSGVDLAGTPQRGVAALVIAVRDLGAAARAVDGRGVATGTFLDVPPASASGVLIRFVTS